MHSRLPSSRPTSRNALENGYPERPRLFQRRPFSPIDPAHMREGRYRPIADLHTLF